MSPFQEEHLSGNSGMFNCAVSSLSHKPKIYSKAKEHTKNPFNEKYTTIFLNNLSSIHWKQVVLEATTGVTTYNNTNKNEYVFFLQDSLFRRFY